MYLKLLEMQGFKSFPEKIRLEFNRGITAVVGPNGSGKSNIADAVRWALGEQSAKSLRGAKMEDVIFAGTLNRRPLGFAEVSMTLDNTDEKLRVAFSEITVTRRVFRSGESEYHMNGTPCRLRDIHELFMDTGVGREGYSIISQGRIEEVLSARSEERRLLFEEAAGIVKYKNRRQETTQELERTKQNLLRANDIIAELEGQLGPLEAQAEKARAYLALKEQLKNVQISLFFSELTRLEGAITDTAEAADAVAGQARALEARREDWRAAQGRYRDQSQALDGERRQAAAALEAHREAAAKAAGDIQVTREQIQFIQTEFERLRREIAKTGERMALLTGDKQGEEEKTAALEASLAELARTLEEARREAEALEARMAQAERDVETQNADMIRRVTRAAEVKGALHQARREYAQLEDRQEQLREKTEAAQAQIAARVLEKQDLDRRLAEARAGAAQAEAALAALTAEKNALAAQTQQQAAAHAAVSRKLHEDASRHKLLSELARNHEGYYKSVRVLLARMGTQGFEGIRGAVGELMTVPKAHEQALEAALGGALQNIVTNSAEDARLAIEFLKKQSAGRATFLPLDAIRPRGGAVPPEAAGQPGFIGLAKNLAAYDPAYEGVFESLLGKVLVVDTMHTGIALHRRLRFAYKIVTLEGEVFSVGGAMTGGGDQRNLFGRRRETEELAQALAALEARRETLLQAVTTEQELAQALSALEAERDALAGALEGLAGQTHEVRAQIAQGRETLQGHTLAETADARNAEALAATLLDLRQRQEAYAGEGAEVTEQLAACSQETRRREAALAALETETAQAQARLEAAQAALQTGRAQQAQKTQTLTELMVRKNGMEQTLQTLRQNIGRAAQGLQGAQQEIQGHETELAAKEGERLVKEGDLAALEARRETLLQAVTTEQERILELDNQKDDVLDKITALECAVLELTEDLARLSGEQARLEARQGQLEEDRRRLYDELWEEYQLTYQGALAYPKVEGDPDHLKRQERRLRAALHELGPDVNVGALEEYKQVKGRYEVLTGQRADILAAEEKLAVLIAELTERMERQFSQQFRLISENFSAVFQEMFGGGTAYLELADAKNVLESGIDIIAQPPGKKLQSMSLLSGGERALTATALLFGILRMKPSPFCILDEVEAALDDANVLRYANFLKNIAHETQFILITHRKGTMEAADRLYGVTMQELGVSALVSVKFTEN